MTNTFFMVSINYLQHKQTEMRRQWREAKRVLNRGTRRMQDISEWEEKELKKPKVEKRINKIRVNKTRVGEKGRKQDRRGKGRPLEDVASPLRLTIRINSSPYGGRRRAPGTLYHWWRGRCTPTHRRGPIWITCYNYTTNLLKWK